jgi:type I restriction enzyme S subunit
MAESQVNFANSTLLSVPISLPPLPEQRRIAEIFDTLDEAIRKTEQLILKLKQVKQGLLHDLLTRGIDDNGELRDPERYPEQFKESPLGKIPKQWEVAPLEKFLASPPKNGYSPDEAGSWTGRLMLGLGCLTPDGFVPTQLKFAPKSDRRVDASILRTGDLLVSRANTRDLVGLVGRYGDVGHPCSYPDLMMRLEPHANFASGAYLELVLRSGPVRQQIQAAAVGTSASMVKISGAIVRSLHVAIPLLREQERILGVHESTKQRLATEEAELGKLRALKNGLMEDLLTGRVRVTELNGEAAA